MVTVTENRTSTSIHKDLLICLCNYPLPSIFSRFCSPVTMSAETDKVVVMIVVNAIVFLLEKGTLFMGHLGHLEIHSVCLNVRITTAKNFHMDPLR